MITPNRIGWDLYEALKQKNKATVWPLLDVTNYYTTEEMEPKHLMVGTEESSTDRSEERRVGKECPV